MITLYPWRAGTYFSSCSVSLERPTMAVFPYSLTEITATDGANFVYG